MPKGRHPLRPSNKLGPVSTSKAKTNFTALQERTSAVLEARDKKLFAISRCVMLAMILMFLAGLSLDVMTTDSQTGSIATWKLISIILCIVGAIALIWRTMTHVDTYASLQSEADALQKDINRHLGFK